MRWIWDPEKNEANRRIHRLSFEVAILVFEDPLSASKEDPTRTKVGGERWVWWDRWF